MLLDLGVADVLAAAAATTGVLTFLAGIEPVTAMAAVAAGWALSTILDVSSHIARRCRHRASLGWVRGLRVGDTFSSDRGTDVIVSKDAAHVLLMFVDPRVGAPTFLWFGRDAAGVAGLLTWHRLRPRLAAPSSSTSRADLAAEVAAQITGSGAGEEGVRYVEWGRIVHVVPPTTARVLLARLSWELERFARTIQRAWRTWASRRARRRKRAVGVIEDAVLEALYRPLGWRFAAVMRLRWTAAPPVRVG
jgi:hypothetical protein